MWTVQQQSFVTHTRGRNTWKCRQLKAFLADLIWSRDTLSILGVKSKSVKARDWKSRLSVQCSVYQCVSCCIWLSYSS